MVDVLYLATIIAFFALMVAFVHWCERIIGRDAAVDVGYGGIGDEESAEPTDRTDPSSTVKTPEEVTS